MVHFIGSNKEDTNFVIVFEFYQILHSKTGKTSQSIL